MIRFRRPWTGAQCGPRHARGERMAVGRRLVSVRASGIVNTTPERNASGPGATPNPARGPVTAVTRRARNRGTRPPGARR